MSRQEEVTRIKQEIIQRAEEKEKKIKREHRKLLRLLLLMLLEFYHHYSVDGKLILNRYQRESFMVQVEKLLMEKVGAMAALEKEMLEKLLKEIYEDAYIKHGKLLDRTSLLTLNPELNSSHVHKEFKGDTFDTRIHRNKQQLVTKLYYLINAGLKEGKDYQNLTKEIDKAFQYSGYQSKRLIMTEESRIFNLAQLAAFKVMDYKGKIMWCSVLCHTTCDYCESMHEEIFYIEDSLPDIPAHSNCQCFWLPV